MATQALGMELCAMCSLIMISIHAQGKTSFSCSIRSHDLPHLEQNIALHTV